MSEQQSNIVVIKLAEAPQPVFKEQRSNSVVFYGEKNEYPSYLQLLVRNAPKHGAIVSGKAGYVAGNGFALVDGATDPTASGFIARANRYGESLNDILAKAALDYETHEGSYLQIIWGNASKKIAEVYHVDFSRIRSNEDNTQFHWCKDWGSYRRDVIPFPAFNPANPYGSQILYLKGYHPGMGTYALPGYLRALNYISAEIEVGRHVLGNARTGFKPSKHIAMMNGDPTPETKRKITKQYQEAMSGADGHSFIISFNTDPSKKPQIDDLGASDLTREDFTRVDELIQANIYAAHEITTPALFGIAQPGKLGSRTEMRDGYEIFKNTYVNKRQRFLEQHFNTILRHAGAAASVAIQPVEPIGIEFSEATLLQIAPLSFLQEKAGIDPTKYADAPTSQPQQAEQAGIGAVGGMSGRQYQNMRRIIRNYKKGTTPRAEAETLLKTGYGLSPQDIAALLDDPTDEMQMGEQVSDDEILAAFADCGEPMGNYSVLKSKPLRVAFADAQVSTLEASILDLISKDKRITAETLADVLSAPIDDVRAALRTLKEAGTIKVSGKPGEEETTLTKPLKEATEGEKPKTREFRVMYSYEGPQDRKNRPFCAKLMAMGKFFTRTDIETVSRRTGYSVWDRRGGFYHNPSTGETTPYCRHRWMSHLVLKES